MLFRLLIVVTLSVLVSDLTVMAQEQELLRDRSIVVSDRAPDWLRTGRLSWESSRPLIEADPETLPDSPEHPWLAIKDPSIVRFQNRWHLFCSLRKQKSGDGRIRIGYTSFGDWEDAMHAKWSLLDLTPGYHGAPQVFFFEPQKLWYLIYQAEDASRATRACPGTEHDVVAINAKLANL